MGKSLPRMPRSRGHRLVFRLLIQALAKKEARGATRPPPEALRARRRA